MRLRTRAREALRMVTLAACLAGFVGRSAADTLPAAAGVDIPAMPRSSAAGSLAAARPPDLTLLIFDVKDLLGPERDEMQREVRGIFSDMGVSVGFKQGGIGTTYGGSAVSPEIPIIVLDVPPGGAKQKDLVLGLVPKHASPPAVWVFAENIRKALGILPAFSHGAQASQDVAVAAGRVIAHETVHALAPRLPHTRGGLMSFMFDKAALRGPARPEQEACVAAVQEALNVKARPLVAPAAAAADARAGTPRF